MWAVAPEVKTIQQPVQFLNGQHDGLVSDVGRCFETFGLQALKPEAKTVALPVEYFHSITGAIQEDEEYRVEHCDFDIQFDQSGQAVD